MRANSVESAGNELFRSELTQRKSGKIPYVPKQTMSDNIIQKTSAEFSEAHSERVSNGKALKIESTLSRAGRD